VSNVYKETAEGLSLEGPSAAVCRQTRKSGEMGRKIATKETQEGCLSFSINRFPELFKVLENASSLSKRLFRHAAAEGPSLEGPSAVPASEEGLHLCGVGFLGVQQPLRQIPDLPAAAAVVPQMPGAFGGAHGVALDDHFGDVGGGGVCQGLDGGQDLCG